MSSDIAVSNVMSRGLWSEWRSFLQACNNEHLIISGSMVGGVCLTWIRPTTSAVRSSGRILVQLTVNFNSLVWKRPRPGLVVTRSFSNFWMRPTNSFNVMLDGLRAESWAGKEWNGRSGSNRTMSNPVNGTVHGKGTCSPCSSAACATRHTESQSSHIPRPWLHQCIWWLLSRAVSNGSS